MRMDLLGGGWIKIVLFCVAVLFIRACVWRSKGLYDQFHGGPSKSSALFVFGDWGNVNYISSSVAAHESFASNGTNLSGKPTGCFSNGRTVFDFLASMMGVDYAAPCFLPGVEKDISKAYNFASASSGLLDCTLQQRNGISFGRQVNEFRNMFSVWKRELGNGFYQAEGFMSDSVIAVNVGANDIAGNYMVNASLSNRVSPEAFIESLLQSYKTYLLSLHEIGGRKFIVFGISALGCSPGMRYSGFKQWNGGCDETANKLFQQFNSGLQKLLHHLNTNLKGSLFIYVNSYDLLLNIIHNGNTLGFYETQSACCGKGLFNAALGCGQSNEVSVCKDLDKYVFWDAFHLAERVQKIIAEEVWNGSQNVIRNVDEKSSYTMIPKSAATEEVEITPKYIL